MSTSKNLSHSLCHSFSVTTYPDRLIELATESFQLQVGGWEASSFQLLASSFQLPDPSSIPSPILYSSYFFYTVSYFLYIPSYFFHISLSFLHSFNYFPSSSFILPPLIIFPSYIFIFSTHS